jgi:hypothetical protein
MKTLLPGLYVDVDGSLVVSAEEYLEAAGFKPNRRNVEMLAESFRAMAGRLDIAFATEEAEILRELSGGHARSPSGAESRVRVPVPALEVLEP